MKEEQKIDLKQKNVRETNTSDSTFDPQAYKCASFIEGLNKCNSKDEVIKYIDSIVSSFSYAESKPKIIGSSGRIFSKNAWSNDGIYNGFIDPSIKISNDTLGYSYKIYDNDYLYDFALGMRKLGLNSKSSLLAYVMTFLDHYFGFPKAMSIEEMMFYIILPFNMLKNFIINTISQLVLKWEQLIKCK